MVHGYLNPCSKIEEKVVLCAVVADDRASDALGDIRMVIYGRKVVGHRWSHHVAIRQSCKQNGSKTAESGAVFFVCFAFICGQLMSCCFACLFADEAS